MTELETAQNFLPQDTLERTELQSVVSHFWISTFPFFETVLMVVPALQAAGPDNGLALVPAPACAALELFDADGNCITESSVEFPAGEVGILELEPLMAMCKLESGLKHGQLVVRSAAGTRHMCRIHCPGGASLLGEPAVVTAKRGGFFPTRLCEEISALLCMVNRGEVEAKTRVRLFCGNRTPEINCVIPPFGSRVVSVPAEFAEVSRVPADTQLQAYLRVSVSSGVAVGIQLIEHAKTGRDTGRYYALS